MPSQKPQPTIDELFGVLERTRLPTVLVEGKNDVIFYREVEEELRDIGVDILPAGNKDAVLELRRRIKKHGISSSFAFIVDKDTWVYTGIPSELGIEEVITTDGYSIENDLFVDGKLIDMLSINEKDEFSSELKVFCRWYALSISRHLMGNCSEFRTHPGKVLDDKKYYQDSISLFEGEIYPENLFEELLTEFSRVLRGKSLFAILSRQLSRTGRPVKFSEKQLLAFASSRKGEQFRRICVSVRKQIELGNKVP